LQAGGLVICPDPLFSGLSERIGALSARRDVPAAYKGREFAEGGGLLAYGTSITDAYHLAGVFTARILKGDKPADLPVLQATKFELVIKRMNSGADQSASLDPYTAMHDQADIPTSSTNVRFQG
jgi:putative tryptophan/tyrosine transport system substrate-binding protein